MEGKKYFHEMSESEFDALFEKNMSNEDVAKMYKQPDWCGYPNALHPSLGCWSLTGANTRGQICREFCSSCGDFKDKIE